MSAAQSAAKVTHDIDVNLLDNGADSWNGRVTFESRVRGRTVRLELEQSASPTERGAEPPVVAFLGLQPGGVGFALDRGDDAWPLLQAIGALIDEAQRKYPRLAPRALALATAEREKALLRPRRPRRAAAAR